MNERLYRLGLSLVRATFRLPPLARVLALFSRVWARQYKLLLHLQRLNFDGVIDGGANIGEFSHLVRTALPKTDLLCIEPHPPSAERLRRQGFRVVEAALWHSGGRVRLNQPTAASTSCTLTSLPPGALSHGEWSVDAVRLDDLSIAGNRLLVKLDLQGAEPAAFEGMETLWARTAAVLLEMPIGPGSPGSPLEDLLRRRGFFEYSTTNELIEDGWVIEADKLWIRPELRSGPPQVQTG